LVDEAEVGGNQHFLEEPQREQLAHVVGRTSQQGVRECAIDARVDCFVVSVNFRQEGRGPFVPFLLLKAPHQRFLREIFLHLRYCLKKYWKGYNGIGAVGVGVGVVGWLGGGVMEKVGWWCGEGSISMRIGMDEDAQH
jgi:hypothetical protein